MSSPWDKSLAELSSVLKDLEEESEVLNRTIADFEQALVNTNPGIAVWCAPPLRLENNEAQYTSGSQLGFAKFGAGWGLYVRRGDFEKDGEGWVADPNGWTAVKLLDSTREERVLALDRFAGLVEALKVAAHEHLESVKRANKGRR
jgi:hypothetical protein